MISIGAVIGGPECEFFDTHLSRFSRYCGENRDLGTHSAEVNIVYHLAGSIWKPDYIYMRTGKFSRKEKTLMIQISVEEEWIASRDDKTVLCYIYETADEAVGMAKGELHKHGIEYDLEADRAFLDRWKEGEGFHSYLDTLGKKAEEAE